MDKLRGGGKERGSGKKSGAVAEIWPLAKLCCAVLQDIFVLLVLKRSFMVGKEGGKKHDGNFDLCTFPVKK